MIAYIPIPNGTTPNQDVIDSLLLQVDKVEIIECGGLRNVKDSMRYVDIGKGRVQAMRKAFESGDEFFVINNSGALHKDEYGIARCIHFLKKNPTWAGVSLPNKVKHKKESCHVAQECVVYRTDAVKDLSKYIKWTPLHCECIQIRKAITSFKKLRLGYLELVPKHIQDIGRGFTI